MTDHNVPAFWEAYYRDQQVPWDLGGPTPVFRRLLDEGVFPPGEMIVLGAGRGHDARMFARAGFTVTAVDFAAAAVKEMEELAAPDAPLRLLQADLFQLPPDLGGAFDYVLEYTCFCAIDPRRRDEYADVVDWLLRPDGRYIALAFPTDSRFDGPPFQVSPQQMMRLFGERGFTLERYEQPFDSVRPRLGREELLILRKGDD